MRRLVVFLLFIGSLSASHTVHADEQCDIATGMSMVGGPHAPWGMRIQLNPNEVPLNEPFDAVVTICSQTELLPVRLTVDAIMPAHKHGMNYKPKTSNVDGRTYKVKNLLFHMPGIWRLEVTAFDKNNPHRFSHEVNLQ